MTKTSANQLAALLYGTKLDRKLSKEDYRAKIEYIFVNNEPEAIRVIQKVNEDWIGPGSTWTKEMDPFIGTLQSGRFCMDNDKKYFEIRTERGCLFFPPESYQITNPAVDGSVDRITNALYMQDAEYELGLEDFVQLLINL